MYTNVYLIIVFYIYVYTCVNIYTLHAIALGFIRQAATFFFGLPYHSEITRGPVKRLAATERRRYHTMFGDG